tara:strand:- start:12903 stop:13163 length:261 start_codon:yes stop_codon:yes gene_type:complete
MFRQVRLLQPGGIDLNKEYKICCLLVMIKISQLKTPEGPAGRRNYPEEVKRGTRPEAILTLGCSTQYRHLPDHPEPIQHVIESESR